MPHRAGAWPWEPDQLHSSGFFVLRTPLLPFDELTNWADGVATPGHAFSDRLEEAVEADRRVLRARLLEIVSRPEVREALFLASPDLVAASETWKADPDGRRGPGIERALVRYVVRMASRPTPFGLLAGCSVGSVGPATRMELVPCSQYRRRTRLSVDYLASVSGALGEVIRGDRQLRGELVLRPNSTMYRAGGAMRFVRAGPSGLDPTYRLVCEPCPADLAATVDRAAAGATAGELVAALNDAGVSPDVAQRQVGGLVDEQALLTSFVPSVTGADGVASVSAALRHHARTAAAAERLEGVEAALRQLDEDGLGASVERYREIAHELAGLTGRTNLPAVHARDRQHLLHAQLVKPAPGSTLSQRVVDEIRRGVATLHRLAPQRRRPDLERFHRDFARRFGEREVSLMEALDEDLGVGFGPEGAPGAALAEPALDGLDFPPLVDDGWSSVRPASQEAVLAARLAELRPGAELVLDALDVDMLANPSPMPLPGCFSVLATVGAASSEDPERDEVRVVLDAVGGPSGAWLLGRFCHADPELLAQVERHLAAEERADPDALWAEVVHLPAGPMGNVVVRPVLRRYEIPVLGVSGAPADHQIPLSDLFVSRRDGQLVLRSKTLGRRVVPRLTSAHDFTRSPLPIYRFLCALQVDQVLGGLSWSWGALAQAPNLPRVRCGQVVLARARWRLAAVDLDGATNGGGADMHRWFAAWRVRHGVPRWVVLAEGDQSLVVDFDNVLSLDALADVLRGRESAWLEELLPGPDDLCVRGPEGAFVHQVVVPFVFDPRPDPTRADRSGDRSVAQPVAAGTRSNQVAVRLRPDGEWLGVRVYLAPSAVDTTLRERIAPLCAQARAAGGVDSWHFLRGRDPDWYLEVRLHGHRGRIDDLILGDLQSSTALLVNGGPIWRLQVGPHEREVERFGGPRGVVLAETVSCADSDAVVEMLGHLAPGDAGSDVRWRLGLVAADALLDGLCLGGTERLAALRRRRESLAGQLSIDSQVEGQLSRRFRRERSSLEAWSGAIRDGGHQAPGFPPAAVGALRTRSARIDSALCQLRDLELAGELSRQLAGIGVELVDGCLARILRSAHARQSLVIYDFLVRLHVGRLGRMAAASASAPQPAGRDEAG